MDRWGHSAQKQCCLPHWDLKGQLVPKDRLQYYQHLKAHWGQKDH